jgi:hypothetical protein
MAEMVASAGTGFVKDRPSVFSQVLSAKRLMNFGAGEGIRTLDPNLGKVVLYP